MSWLYSRVLVEEYLGDISLDGEQSVQLSGSNTQLAYCALDKMTGFSRLSRFGMTYKPLTENLGEELLTLFRGAFPVRTLVPQEKEQALQETDRVCGNTWPGLLARYDLNSHSWRTVQCSLLEDLNESLQTLPKWGMTVGGELYLLPKLVQTTDENEFGLSEKWSTPIAGLSKHSASPEYWNNRILKGRQTDTHMEVVKRMWGTPKAQDSRHALRDRGKGNLGEQVSGLHNGGHLNPTWTEWLMGWPLGWTDLKPLETDKYHSVQPPLGNYLHKETNDLTLD